MSGRSLLELFVETLAVAAAKAFSEKSPAPWTVTLEEKPRPFAAGAQLLTLQLITEPSKAEAAIQLNLDGAALLASTLTGTSVGDAQLKPEHAHAVRSAFAKACESAAAQLVVPGLQVQVQLVKAINWSAAKQFSMAASDGASGKFQFQFLVTPDWPKMAQSTAKTDATPTRPATEAGNAVTVSMLENVELDVTLRFGQRQLSLREIGDLRSGSVIELDKYVQDPAELLL